MPLLLLFSITTTYFPIQICYIEYTISVVSLPFRNHHSKVDERKSKINKSTTLVACPIMAAEKKVFRKEQFIWASRAHSPHDWVGMEAGGAGGPGLKLVGMV